MDTEVLIVGAGPGGLSAAITLSKSGFKTTLIDQKLSIGEPVKCGEGEWENELESLKIPYKNFVSNKINYTKIIFPEDISILTKNAAYVILDRNNWEKNLAKIAANNGCNIFSGTCAKELVFQNGIVKAINAFQLKEKIIFKPKFLILADGRFSIIRNYKEKINIDWNNYEKYILSAQYWMINIPIESNTRELYIDKSITEVSYAWVFPKGEDEANIGLSTSVGKNPIESLDNFLLNKKKLHKRNIIRITTASIPISPPLSSHNFGNILLVGDAARLNDTISNGGIERALISGRKAAETIIENHNEGSTLSNYEFKLEPLIRKLQKSYQLRIKYTKLTQKDLILLGKRWKDVPKKDLNNITLREILSSA